MRWLALVIVAALAVGALLLPDQEVPVSGAPAPLAAPAYRVCPLSEAAARSTTLTMVGGASGGAVQAEVFSAGEVVVEESLAMSEAGNGAVDVNELTGLAAAPVLLSVEQTMPATQTILSGGGIAAAACVPAAPDTQVMVGGATAEGHTYSVVLANPFVVSANVDVIVASEVGTESDDALSGVVVPPRSSVSLDLHSRLPGRQAMSLAVVTNHGRVVAGARHGAGGDVSAMTGIAESANWFLPVPALEDVSRALVVFAPDTTEAPFQVDVYSEDGVMEAAYEDVVPARGQVVVPVGDLMEGPGALRVVSAAPVVAGLRLAGDGGRAVIPGVPEAGPSWVLSGAGRLGETIVHVFNPSEVEASVQLQSGNGGEITTVAVPQGTMVDIPLPARDFGARVEADADVIVSWTTRIEEGLAGDAATPSGG